MNRTQDAIARAVRVRLTRTGQRHADLAERMGIKPSTLSNLLAGRTTLTLDRTEDLAHALDLAGAFELMDLARREARKPEHTA